MEMMRRKNRVSKLRKKRRLWKYLRNRRRMLRS